MNTAALAQYGDWLRKKDDPKAVGELNKALQIDPRNVLANYDLGLIYEKSSNHGDHAQAERYFREAEFVPAFTADDFLSKANAAVQLMNYHVDDKASWKADHDAAMVNFGQSIAFTPGAVYAYNGRANLEKNEKPKQATSDAEAALRLLPYAGLIRNTCEQMPTCKRYESKRFMAIGPPKPPNAWQGITWSAKACKYHDLDFDV